MAEPSGIRCDLVLLSWNHLEETQPCLDTLFGSTQVPCRLLIVDNGSEPPVREFLRSVKPSGAIREVVLLQNDTNEGFPKGMNRGVAASSAPFVCLLNNDLRFTTGWLEELITLAEAHADIGVLNPASSNFGDHPPAGMSLEDFAARRRSRRGEFSEVGMCIGFCMLIRREVIAKIGGLTEEVERIFFEDEDYSMRAQVAGYRCVVVESAYVHHAEHKTVTKMPEREALFARNQTWCNGKWGRRLRIAWPQLTALQPGSDELRQWLSRLVLWARRRNHVYAYYPMNGFDRYALFRSVGLAPHGDIHWYPIPERLAPAAAAVLILKRRKKPFDVIAAPDHGPWTGFMKRMAWMHRTDIIGQSHEEQLLAAWMRKSRSPS